MIILSYSTSPYPVAQVTRPSHVGPLSKDILENESLTFQENVDYETVFLLIS